MASSPPTRLSLVEFARAYLGPDYELDPWQQQLLEALERGHAECGRRGGRLFLQRVYREYLDELERRHPARVLPFTPRR